MRLVTKLFSTFFLNIIIVILVFGTSVVISRVLGPERFGIYRFVVLIAGTLTMAANFGFPEMVQLSLAKKLIRLKDYLATSLTATMPQYLIALCILGYYLYRQDDFNDKNLLAAVLLYCLLFQLNFIFHNAIFALDRIVRFQSFEILKQSCFLSLSVALYFQKLLTVEYVLWILAFVNTFSIIYILYVNIKKKYTEKVKLAFSKELLKNSLRTYINNLLTFATYRLGMYILKFSVGFYEIGIYSLAITLVEKIWLLPESIRSVLYLELSNKRQGERFVAQIIRALTVFILVGGICIAILSHFMIPLIFGTAYFETIKPFIILIPGVMMFCFSKVLASYFIVMDMIKINTYSSLIIAVINITLSFILIPTYFITGAAIATSIAYVVGSVYHIIIFKAKTKLRYSELFIIRIEDIKQLKSLRKRTV